MEGIFHELVLVGINVGGNVVIWRYLLPDRKLLAIFVFVALIIIVYLLAKRWQVDLTYL